MTCAHETCVDEPTVTVEYPLSNVSRGYCDHHMRHLVEARVPMREIVHE